MPSGEQRHDLQTENAGGPKQNIAELIFGDPEATRTLVGFFDLALKVHMRIHPELHGNVTTQSYD